MNRAVVLALTGALLGVLGWWFTSNFGFTTKRVYVGYGGEARHNHFFAAALLLERMGKEVRRQAVFDSADALPDGVDLLLPLHRADLDPPGVDALLAWVERGGRLVLGVEIKPLRKDPLLEALGVGVEEAQRSAGRIDDRPPPERVTLPDGRTLRVDLRGSVILVDEGRGAAWRHSGPHGDRILVLKRGSGRIIVVSTLAPFNNAHLNELDHAALLWHLFQDAGREVIMVNRLHSVSLLEWLTGHAPAALTALGVVIALWLWRVIPRFGPLRPTDSPARRSLLEHVRAIGRFQADAQQLGRLTEQVRRDAQALFERSAPLAAALDGTARLREASRLTGLRPRELMHAFAGSVSTRNEFSNALRTLAAFRRRLAQRSPREQTR